MKRLNATLKLCIAAVVVIFAVSSCDDSDDSDRRYSPENETAQINTWKAKMKTDNVAYDSTATKIYYIIDKTKVGTGSNVKAGNKVTVKYTGKYLDGSIFDASAYHGDGTMTYVHKTDRLISGWEEGIELLNKGAKATFLIPSLLAYGPTGYYTIPPYSPLFFEIEVVDIK